MPTDYWIFRDFNCFINKRETSKTRLTNNKVSISHHIRPLVISNLGGRHINTHTHTHIADKRIFKKPVAKGWHTPGFKILIPRVIYMYG